MGFGGRKGGGGEGCGEGRRVNQREAWTREE